MSDVRGRWRHYKGHEYEALGIAKHSETGEELGVAYQRRDADELFVWVRPTAMFSSMVELPGGTTVVRFERLGSETSVVTAQRLRDEAQDCAENHYTAEEGRVLEARIKELEAQLATRVAWSEDDLPLPEDKEIHRAHPTRSGHHDVYAEAFRMVGAKRSKFALVDLVNWLLVRLKDS